MLELILEELARTLPDARETVRITLQLLAALLAGGVIGYQRERIGKAAGLRTHMMVSLGTALFVISGAQSDMGPDAVSRIVQGVAAGIGFLGAGAILKLESERAIKGLTTAAGIWMTAALGVTIGLGQLGAAAIALVFSWLVLVVLFHLEKDADHSGENA